MKRLFNWLFGRAQDDYSNPFTVTPSAELVQYTTHTYDRVKPVSAVTCDEGRLHTTHGCFPVIDVDSKGEFIVRKHDVRSITAANISAASITASNLSGATIPNTPHLDKYKPKPGTRL